ncbi:MAG: ArsR/SmtB family transcription factor [Candidatus Bathyarchaeia archaeon]
MNNYTYEYLFIQTLEAEKTKKSLNQICYRFFTNLANPTRLAAIEQLLKQPLSVGELAAALGQEQSMISHNLKPLLTCNIITIHREGKKHIYTVNTETIAPIFAAIENHAQKFCPTNGKCLKEEKP